MTPVWARPQLRFVTYAKWDKGVSDALDGNYLGYQYHHRRRVFPQWLYDTVNFGVQAEVWLRRTTGTMKTCC